MVSVCVYECTASPCRRWFLTVLTESCVVFAVCVWGECGTALGATVQVSHPELPEMVVSAESVAAPGQLYSSRMRVESW